MTEEIGQEPRRGSWWFGNTAGEDAEHRHVLRESARLAAGRERNYDQPWWGANVVALLDEVESLRADLAEARQWAWHGYEIGQRSATWSDHGVAPRWLLDGPPGAEQWPS